MIFSYIVDILLYHRYFVISCIFRSINNIQTCNNITINNIGRGFIVHADEDYSGEGGNEESIKTGNAGKHIACAIIGYSKANYC